MPWQLSPVATARALDFMLKLRGADAPIDGEADISELALHIKVAEILRQRATPEWLWCHVPNGEARDASHGAKLKALGVKPGWPDLQLISLPHGQVRFIELKRPGGKLSEVQREFQTNCVRFAVPFAVIHTVEEAMVVLRHWNVVPPKETAVWFAPAAAKSTNP